MCLIGVSIGVNKHYPFILCANRDEFYERETKEAHFWRENPSLIAGKDLEKGGTWLGLSTSGEIAALTNVRSGAEVNHTSTSRGEIISSFFNDRNRFEKILEEKEAFAGFNLLYGNVHELTYTTNQEAYDDLSLKKGIHVLSNAAINSPWPKAKKLEVGLQRLEGSKQEVSTYLFDLLSQSDPFPDKELPNTGVGLDLERKLSPIHIQTDKYGTKSSTVILIDHDKNATFIEKTYGRQSKQVSYHFPVGSEK